MRHLVSALLVVAAIIHLLPLSGVIGGERLLALYGIAADDPNLALLLRHRAVLFGLLGGLLLYAAFEPTARSMALIAGLISTLAFLGLAWSVGSYNGQMARVVVADIVAVVCLVVSAGIHWYPSLRS